MNWKNEQGSKILDYLIPLFIVAYFSISFYPIFLGKGSEIFPFFSFKLYSKTPQDFEHFDILLNPNDPNCRYLLFGNSSLNQLEQKYIRYRLSELSTGQKNKDKINLRKFDHWLIDYPNAKFVRIRGNYIDAVNLSSFKIDSIP